MEKNAGEAEIIIRSCAACGRCSKSCPAHINISEALKIYGEYLFGDVQTLEKLNEMKSPGKPVDCIECGVCSSHCPNGLDVKELMWSTLFVTLTKNDFITIYRFSNGVI